MKKVCVLFMACIAMVFVSCSDDDDGDNGGIIGNKGRLVSKITEVDDEGIYYSYAYEYDKQGRLTKEFSSSNEEYGSEYTTTYTYTDKIVTEQIYDKDGDIEEILIYALNDNGHISSEKSYYEKDKNGNIDMTKPAYTSFYHYDNNNQLIRESGEDNFTFSWNNGNIVTWESQGGSGDTWKNTFTYTKYENKSNLDLGFEVNIGNLYVSKYLVEKDSFKRNGESEYDRNSAETTYTYKFDKDGYVIEITCNKKNYRADGSLEDEYTSTYTIEYFN